MVLDFNRNFIEINRGGLDYLLILKTHVIDRGVI